MSGFTCFCLANAAFDGAFGASFIRNHSSTALAIASFTAWFVRLFLVGGTDTAIVDVFAVTDVDEVVVSAKPKFYLCSRCKGCFIFMSV